ncbi:unnamed protein product [Symbiodinium necroappetens]|uniref:Uncharacterized protein n=1 Tax=Symbiodinium necroappetens TaxID=1628268 RepID=A0A812P7G5_9DINO|nr:unnamed protein product [Symbiodinium necroappetens]CAE7475671.1 unnamed protein product [Symbiodinium sp. KB8]CAE7741054.1 unnamed protein product [Symbiodinium microadriaticum]
MPASMLLRPSMCNAACEPRQLHGHVSACLTWIRFRSPTSPERWSNTWASGSRQVLFG